MSSLGDTPVDPTLNVPLYWQLYLHLRSAILTERLKKGMKLPSTRALADELHVSRNTVVNAYEQLLAEGYLESIAASGTYVASVLPDHYLTLPASSTASNAIKPGSRARLRLSKIGEARLAAPAPLSPRASVYQSRAFVAGMPALDAFPYELWAKLVARQARQATADTLMYQDPAGYPPLRTAIAEHITVTRQVRCTPAQILIVAGSQGALDLVARLLLNPGDTAWVEDPGYPGARGALIGAGAQIVPVPVDNAFTPSAPGTKHLFTAHANGQRWR